MSSCRPLRLTPRLATYSWIIATPFPIAFPCTTPPSPRTHRLLYPLQPSITSCAKIHARVVDSVTKREPPHHIVKILPLEVVQHIAAGEVITGYDSVIQELVENSIDANANVINVDIDLFASRIIVQDDGVGISREQRLVDIARCNATSKLRSLAELNNGVYTLGFRGQGLWAIAMTADRLQISSRTCDSLCGTSVVFKSDGTPRDDSIFPVPMAVGTIATVTGLPWSMEPVEARKTIKRCKDLLLRAAMCYPNVSFHLTRNGKTTWRSVASNLGEEDARIRILSLELKLPQNDFRSASRSIAGVGEMSVVVGIPSTAHSASKSWMMTAVNGRCVAIRSIRRAISALLDVRKGRYPVVFVNIVADPGLVNWNVLPMKTRIRFNSAVAEEKLVSAIPSLLRDALQGSLMSNISEWDAGDTPPLLGHKGLRGGMKSVISLLSSKMMSSYASDVGYGSNSLESGSNIDEIPISMLQARVVAQLLNTYILVEHEGGVMLIEQHVADERVIYEDLVRSWKNNNLVALKEPLKLPENMRTEWIFTLTTLGLISCDDSDDTNDSYEIVAIPEVISGIPESNLLSLILQLCREGTTVEEASAFVACRLAVKNGNELNMKEMAGIVRKLARCDNGFTCPHGRPIFVELHTKELARLFRRSWLPERVKNDKTRRTVLKSQGMLPE